MHFVLFMCKTLSHAIMEYILRVFESTELRRVF